MQKENEAERTVERKPALIFGTVFLNSDISEIYERDERNFVQGPVETCISECMIHSEGWKGGVFSTKLGCLMVCVCLQITLEWAWAQSLRESATLQGYPTVSTTPLKQH